MRFRSSKRFARIRIRTASTGVDALQASGGSQPTFITAAKNGMPVVSFNGTSAYMDVAWPGTTSQPDQMFVVFKMNLLTGSASQIVSGEIQELVYTVSPENFCMNAGSSFPIMESADVSWHIFCLEFNGTQSKFRADNSAMTTVSISPGSQPITSKLRIGNYWNGSQFCPVNIAEIIASEPERLSHPRFSIT